MCSLPDTAVCVGCDQNATPISHDIRKVKYVRRDLQHETAKCIHCPWKGRYMDYNFHMVVCPNDPDFHRTSTKRRLDMTGCNTQGLSKKNKLGVASTLDRETPMVDRVEFNEVRMPVTDLGKVATRCPHCRWKGCHMDYNNHKIACPNDPELDERTGNKRGLDMTDFTTPGLNKKPKNAVDSTLDRETPMVDRAEFNEFRMQVNEQLKEMNERMSCLDNRYNHGQLIVSL